MLLFNMLRGFVNIPSDGLPYVLFSYAALVPWTFFTNSVSACGPSILTNAEIIKKIALPREVFPLAAVAATAFDFLMSGIILAGMMVWFKVSCRLGFALVACPDVAHDRSIIRSRYLNSRFGDFQKGFHFRHAFLDSGLALCYPGNLSIEYSS